MDIAETVTQYGKVYTKVLAAAGCADIEAKLPAYEKRLGEMYASEKFAEHNIYPTTTNAEQIYAVIAMCLELKGFGFENDKIIDLINKGFGARRGFFKKLAQCIDILPSSYKIAEKWNISDHDKRTRDGSVVYDSFDIADGRIEYSISKCAYVDMFEAYGIRPLCKIFCMTDTTIYGYLAKHVKFTRYSDLSDGDCCHDLVEDRRKIKG